MPTDPRPLLVVRHVPWEGPGRILDPFGDRPVLLVDSLEPEAVLPPVDAVAGAVFMGGPMSVNDADRLPGLAAEIAWIEGAIAADVPVLGVCLGSQLIARALGAEVRPGPAPELGWAPLEVLDPADQLLSALAPQRTVLHWHGEVFDLPPGATALARSAQTAVQAFRAGSAWGLLFHVEADPTLLDVWLADPSMVAEAERALGPGAADQLRAAAHGAWADLEGASNELFARFAALVAARDAA